MNRLGGQPCTVAPPPAPPVLGRWADSIRAASQHVADLAEQVESLLAALGVPPAPGTPNIPPEAREGAMGEVEDALDVLSARRAWLDSAVSRLMGARLA